MLETDDQLYVVTCLFNPTNVEIRYKLYRDFENYIKSFKHVTLVTVELALGDQPFVVTQKNTPNHIQLRTNDVLWYKENLINIGIKSLPKSAQYVAWIDADTEFTNKDWVRDTLLGLKHFRFIQMFDTCESLGPEKEILQSDRSFVYRWANNIDNPKIRGRSGGAWAARIETLKEINYLIDWDIVGASDWYTAFGLTNQAPQKTTPCRAKNEIWLKRVFDVVDGNVYYLDGTLLHFFHGYPKDRGYGTRGAILIDNNFDPNTDIGYRDDGLLYLKTDKPKLRQDLIEYFESRKDHG